MSKRKIPNTHARHRQTKPGSAGGSVSRRAGLSVDEARFLNVRILKPAVKPKSRSEAEAIRRAVRQVLKDKPLVV